MNSNLLKTMILMILHINEFYSEFKISGTHTFNSIHYHFKYSRLYFAIFHSDFFKINDDFGVLYQKFNILT